MSRLVSIVALFVLISATKNEAARILAVFPVPSISHQVVFRPLTHELAKRGHHVVVITPDPAFTKGQTPENLTEIDVHDLSYEMWNNLLTVLKTGEQGDIVKQAVDISALMLKIFVEQVKVSEIQEIILNKNDTFDLILTEAVTRFTLGFSRLISVPVIPISSFGAVFDNNQVIGAPSHPFLYPLWLHTRIYNLSLWEKVSQYYNEYTIMRDYYKGQKKLENAVVKQIFGQNMPDLSESQNNIHMLFLNNYPIWESNRPVPPGVVYIGELCQNPQKELPKDLKSYLDSSVNGVIYLSFGTNIDPTVLPRDKIQNIIKAFSQLPYDVLWKWNHGELPGRTKNIRISKWFPQSDLLKHPKIKLFITQGGLQSTDEAITAGVPLIGIPMFADQWYNVEKYVYHQIGLQLELGNLEVESLKSAIETVIGDKSYRENIVRFRDIMNDQPQPPLQRAVWWTEHVLRHGGARHLRAPAANMPWTHYYEIELVLTLLGIGLVVIVLSFIVLHSVLLYLIGCVTKLLLYSYLR